MKLQINQLTHEVIGASIEVHKKLGPGLLEAPYKECLCRELILRGVPFEKERPLPLEYKVWNAVIEWTPWLAAWCQWRSKRLKLWRRFTTRNF